MTINSLYENSELAQAAYSQLVKGSTVGLGQIDALKAVEGKESFTQTQADSFVDRFKEVVAVSDDPIGTGFSATVFSTTSDGNGQLTLAIRGTDELIGPDGGDDAAIYFNGVASEQIVEMVNWWKRVTALAGTSVDQVNIASYLNSVSSASGAIFLYSEFSGPISVKNYYLETTASATGTGELYGRTDQQLSITGHSLGGHLAMAFGTVFSDETESVSVFNAPGFGESIATQNLFQALGTSVPDGIGIVNVVANEVSDGSPPWSAIAGLHGRPGINIDIAIENQLSLSEPDSDDLSFNHSIKILTDSLAVYNLLADFDPALSTEDYNTIFQDSSNIEHGSLEGIVDSVAKFFSLGGTDLPAGNDQREALYQKINDIAGLINPGLEGSYKIDLLGDDAAALANGDTPAGRAHRYALVNLIPFTITGDFTGTDVASAIYNFNDASGDRNHSDTYLSAKAEMLSVIQDRNTNDSPHPEIQPIGSPVYYGDHQINTSFITGQVDLPGGGQALNEFDVSRTVFGDENDNGFILGGAKADHLFGQAGNDSLTGGSGGDYLEGGRGADQFFWSNGDGSDVVGDRDDGGDRIIVNSIDLAVLSFTQKSANSPFYSDSTNPDITLHYDGGALQINVGSGPNKGSITLQEYSTSTGANYGIALSPFNVTPPVGDDVVQALGGSNDPADQETRVSAYDREVLMQRGVDWSTTAIVFDAETVVNYTAGSLHGTLNGAFEGGPVRDYLTGSVGSNALHGWSGNDVIDGQSGDDFLEGGGGSDILLGGTGDDLIFGSSRAGLAGSLASDSARDQFYLGQIASVSTDTNTLDGGAGNDHLSGGDYTDFLEGGVGTDYLLGGTGRDFINGGEDRDIIYGDSALNYRYVELTPGVATEKLEIAFADGSDSVGQYDDVIAAGAGGDTVWGELGDDEIYGGEGDDNLIGDRFNDTTYFSAELAAYAGTSPDLAAVLNGDDKLYGGAGSDLLLGNGGDDFLSGGVGVDSLLGGAGNDIYYSQPGDGLDYVEDTEGVHTLLFANATMDDLQIVFQGDQVRVATKLGSHGFNFSRAQWADTQIALDTEETVIERSRLDTSYVDGSGNVLLTVAGIDTLSEAERDEIFSIDDTDPSRLRVVVTSNADSVEIESLVQQGDGAQMRIGSGLYWYSVELAPGQIDLGFDFLDLADGLVPSLINFSGSIDGTAGAERIVGSSSADYIKGHGGNDVLEGRAGDDNLDGGAGDDFLFGGEGDDDLSGGAGHDRDVLNGGPGNDELNGWYGPDVYQFNAGDGQDLIKDQFGYLYFEFGADVSPASVVLNFTGTTDSSFRLEYGSGDAVFSQGLTEAHWIQQLSVDGIEIPLVLRSDLLDGVFRDTRADDVFEGGPGNDTIYVSGWGDNVFRLFSGDGQDTIYVDNGYEIERQGEIRFAADVDLSTLSYSFLNGSAVISYGAGDTVNLTPDTVYSTFDNTFMRFTLASEADPGWMPTITPQDSNAELYGSFGADNIVGDEGRDIIYPGYGNDVINAGGGPDEVILNDIYMAQGTDGIGYKNISGDAGNDLITTPLFQGLTFNYAMGDGSDIINYDWSYSYEKPYEFDVDWDANTAAFNPKGQDVLSFGEGITLADLQFVRSGDALDVSVHDGAGSIRVEGFFYAWDAETVDAPLDLFELFGEGVGFDSLLQPYVLSLLPKTPISLLLFADGSTYDMSSVLTSLLQVNSLIEGTSGADVITGTAGDDIIVGGRGNDTMDGGAGHDTFIVEGANQGKDLIAGGAGFDTILGGADDDRIRLQSLSVADSIERIDAGAGFNIVAGTNARNNLDFSMTDLLNIAQIEAGAGKDTVIGSRGDDVIVGGAGNDILEGSAGNDTFIVEGVDQGKDLIAGGEGFDTIIGGSLDDQITLKSLSLLDSVERIDGGLGFNTIAGTQGKNNFDFSATELLHIDQINGAGGRDTIIGSQGDDVLSGGPGNDILSGLGGSDSYLFGLGDGRDTIKNNDTASGSTDRLDVTGINYDDLWLSRSGNNLLVDVVGSDDRVKVKGWFASDRQQLDAIYAGDRVLLRNQVGLLVNAMASFDVPTGVGVVIPPDTRLALEPVLANVWEAA